MAELKNEPKIDPQEVLDGIVEWVTIESPSHDAKAVNVVVDKVESQFRDLGLALDRTPGVDGFGDILECKTPPQMSQGEGKGILVLAHLDTVHPIGMIEKDLKIRQEGDSVFGPGIYDMKAGGYIAYYALRHLIRQGKKTRLPVTFLFIPEEEVGSPTSRARIESAARGHKYCLVMEPGRDGDRVVTLAQGRRSFRHHGQGPRLACRRASRGRPQRHPGDGQADPAHRRQDGLCARHHLQCRFDQGRHGRQRRLGGMHGRDRFARTQPAARRGDDALVPGPRADRRDVEVTVTGGMNRPPYQKDAGIAQLFGKAQALYREIGKELLDVPLTGGGSDGNFTAALGIPTLDGLGADGKGAHAAYEQIYFSSLMPRTYLCARLLETLD